MATALNSTERISDAPLVAVWAPGASEFSLELPAFLGKVAPRPNALVRGSNGVFVGEGLVPPGPHAKPDLHVVFTVGGAKLPPRMLLDARHRDDEAPPLPPGWDRDTATRQGWGPAVLLFGTPDDTVRRAPALFYSPGLRVTAPMDLLPPQSAFWVQYGGGEWQPDDLVIALRPRCLEVCPALSNAFGMRVDEHGKLWFPTVAHANAVVARIAEALNFEDTLPTPFFTPLSGRVTARDWVATIATGHWPTATTEQGDFMWPAHDASFHTVAAVTRFAVWGPTLQREAQRVLVVASTLPADEFSPEEAEEISDNANKLFGVALDGIVQCTLHPTNPGGIRPRMPRDCRTLLEQLLHWPGDLGAWEGGPMAPDCAARYDRVAEILTEPPAEEPIATTAARLATAFWPSPGAAPMLERRWAAYLADAGHAAPQ